MLMRIVKSSALAVLPVPVGDPLVPVLTCLVTAYVGTWYPEGAPYGIADQLLLARLPAPYTAPEGAAWVASSGGTPAGCLLALNMRGGCAVEVRKMYVVPALRGLGAGQALLDAAAGFTRACGTAEMTLTVHQDRTHARALYERYGFVVREQEPDGFLRMHASLADI